MTAIYATIDPILLLSGTSGHSTSGLSYATIDPILLLFFTKASVTPPPSSPPTPILYGPLQAVFSNGTNELQVAADEVESTIYATLSDTPPPGMTSNLNLAEATVTLLLRAIGSASPVLSNVGRVVSTTLNQCAYDLQSTDIALLAPGWYKGSFKVLFPSGQTREFPGLLVTVVPAAF